MVNQIIIDLINNSIGINSFTPEPELIKSRFDFSKYYVPYAANCAHPAALMEWHDFHGWLSFSVTQSAAAFMHSHREPISFLTTSLCGFITLTFDYPPLASRNEVSSVKKCLTTILLTIAMGQIYICFQS